MDVLPQIFQQKLRAELNPNEKVVWAAQPDPNQISKSGFLVWIFFIPWTLFAAFWIFGASGFKMPSLSFEDGFSFFPLFGLPFLLIGFAGLSSPLWMKRKALNSVYAITSQRLLVLNFGKVTNVQAYYPKDVTQLERREKSDGSGDLVFASKNYTDSDGDKQTKKDGFYAINEVKKVEKLVEDFLKANNLIK